MEAQPLDEIRPQQMARADVDADRGLDPRGQPVGRLPHCLADGPVAELLDQLVVLDHRHEGGWLQQPPLGMLPAHQGLEADHPAALHVDLGLVGQQELVVREAGLDPLADALFLLLFVRLAGIEEMDLAAAGPLGEEHRMLRLLQHDLGRLLALAHQRHADAGAQPRRAVLQPERMREPGQDLLQQGLGMGRVVDEQQQRELVAPDPGDAGIVRHRGLQAARHLPQHCIPAHRAETLVDVAEMVEVEVADRQQALAVAVAHRRRIQLLERGHAIGQPRQCVMARQQVEPLAAHAARRRREAPQDALVVHALAAQVGHDRVAVPGPQHDPAAIDRAARRQLHLAGRSGRQDIVEGHVRERARRIVEQRVRVFVGPENQSIANLEVANEGADGHGRYCSRKTKRPTSSR